MSENVYSKLQKCRVELQGKKLKKSGQNKFSGYDYYELGDFLPTAQSLFNTYKLTSIVTFEQDFARLTIINTENVEEQIIFSSPQGTANLKGCHEIQNIGAVETYQRRYLYMLALEIVEGDSIDATTDTNKEITLTDKQIARLYAIAKNAKLDTKQVDDTIKKELNKAVKDLTKTEYDAYCSRLQKAVKQ